MQLFEKQTKALDLLESGKAHELVFGGGAGGGKSVLGCYWVLKSAIKYPRTRWVIGRSVYKTLKETTLQSFWEVCRIQGLKPNVHYRFNANEGVVQLLNGSTILLKDLNYYPSDPNFDELGSLEITGAFVDECNQIVKKGWDILKSRIRFKLDEYGLVPQILGTCNPSKNWVYTDFYKEDGRREGAYFLQSLVTDNPNISKHYIENLKQLDPASQERLLYGNWEYDDDPATIFEYDAILDMFSNSVENGEMYLSCDVALQGSDRFVIIVWDGWEAVKIKAVEKCDAQEAENLIRGLAEAYNVRRSHIVYDHDGVGAFLGGYLKGARGFMNGGKPLNDENYANLKSQCYFHLAGLVRDGKVRISDDKYKLAIAEELEQIKRKDVDKDGKLAVLGKEKIKEKLGRSPDFADALMMRCIFDLKKKRAVGVYKL